MNSRDEHLAPLFLLVCFVAATARCTPAKPPSTCAPETYGAQLQLCSASSKTLEESIACENKVRASCGRPLRAMPGKDGGP